MSHWVSRLERKLDDLFPYGKRFLKQSKPPTFVTPSGMSYASLANIPEIYGLYTGLVPPIM